VRRCAGCRGEVLVKVFDCRHPSHDTTTLSECKECVDYKPRDANDASHASVSVSNLTWPERL
jgi:hypothetical protein